MAKSEPPAYDPQSIEPKWQKKWAEDDAFRAPERPDSDKKYYVLEMFPYPSGNLHMGHVRCYTIGDVFARYQRMRGYQVLHPMGWDALGMPAENAAIREGIRPEVRTRDNIKSVKRQMKALGMSYDWEREFATCDPEYYRWNQWLFVKFLEKGLVYRRESEVNWCPSCETVLANEQVVDGKCWRCDSEVIQRVIPEWAFRITQYCDELLQDLEQLGGWPERITTMQRNWIGKSPGVEWDFAVAGSDDVVRVFTTRADTVFGVTYMVLAPEHPLVEKITTPAQKDAVAAFVKKVAAISKEDRTGDIEKEGVDTGARAVNPFTGDEIPIWVGNFVLATYGTGAVMSVPAHDQRDFEFAKKYGLPIRVVIRPADGEEPDAETMEAAIVDYGVMVNSGDFSGSPSAEGIEKVIAHAEKKGFGKAAVNWHLRDWGFSRQRYWGTPIPIIYCQEHGTVPVPEKDLPIVLPPDAPITGEGKPPLAKVESFVRTTCPICGKDAERETETMDTFVDSCWYYLRFCDPHNDSAPFAADAVNAWCPVDLYIGGPEHAVLHLLYFRFFTKVCRDLGLLAFDEPAQRLLTQGIVHKDGAKMSKSKGNVVSPDEMIESYGADTARLFSLFAAPPEKDLEWNEQGVEGSYRFLKRLWTFVLEHAETVQKAGAVDGASLEGEPLALWRTTHKTIKKVTDYVNDRWQFNTAISAIHEMVNAYRSADASTYQSDAGAAVLKHAFESLIAMLFPFAPHFSEELWEVCGHTGGVVNAGWPTHDPVGLVAETMTIAATVNGKLRAQIEVATDASEDEIKEQALTHEAVARHIEGKDIKKVIYVAGRLVNIVAK